jgi:hypothetical protein
VGAEEDTEILERKMKKKELPPLPPEAATINRGQYVHYKGGKYDVLGVGRMADTLEPVVLYKAQDGVFWVRKLADWLSPVKDKPRTKRFKKYDHNDAIQATRPWSKPIFKGLTRMLQEIGVRANMKISRRKIGENPADGGPLETKEVATMICFPLSFGVPKPNTVERGIYRATKSIVDQLKKLKKKGFSKIGNLIVMSADEPGRIEDGVTYKPAFQYLIYLEASK